MTSPTMPTRIIPEAQELIIGIESVAAGTPATVLIREDCLSIETTIVRSTYEHVGYVGAAFTRLGTYETQHHAEISVRVLARPSSLFGLAMGCHMGNGSEQAVTGASPYTHTWKPAPRTSSCNTLTVIHDNGDVNNLLQMVKATVADISCSLNPDGALEATITLTANFPTVVVHPTISHYVGSEAIYPITPFLGSQGQYTLYNSTGAVYPNNILGATLSFSRPIRLLPNAQGLNPADIVPGELVMAGSISFEYDGLGANSVHQDYLAYAKLGDGAGHQHKIVFTNADGHSVEIDFYPMYWTQPTFDKSNQVITVDTAFTTYQDPKSLNTATPLATAPQQLVITNLLASAMTS